MMCCLHRNGDAEEGWWCYEQSLVVADGGGGTCTTVELPVLWTELCNI